MELRWLASTSTSALYAVGQLLAGRQLVDERLASALEGPAYELGSQLTAARLPATRVFSNLVALSAGIGNNTELARVALLKAVGREAAAIHAPAVARRIGDCEAAFLAVYPESGDDLPLRAGPLREQWESRGPGLLAAIARRTDRGLIVERAEVVVVQPALGGGGSAHHLYNCACIEGVLANPHGDLPEIVRLAWLLAQLNTDLPCYQGPLAEDRATAVGSVALVPAVCAAAADVELARDAVALLPRAIEAWKVDVDSAALASWWETYQANRPAWPVALAALDRMLSEP